MNVTWVRIRSWHALDLGDADFVMERTLCGRRGKGRERSDALPAGKSCETCLRIMARKVDA